MKPWEKWCINKNMRWLLYLMVILIIPFALGSYILVAILEAIKEVIEDTKAGVARIKTEPKKKK